MKNFLRKMAPFVLFIVILEIAIPIAVDPYNVFHWRRIRDNGVEPNSNYIKMEYVLHNPDKFDSFLFGSSRTSFVNVDRIPEGKWYNMSYSEGLPREHLENLQELIDHGIVPKTVMIGVDNISCFVNPELHETQFYRIPYPRENKLGFYANYFSIKGVLQSLEVTLEYESEDPDYVDRYYRNGCNSRAGKWGADDTPYWEPYYSDYMGGATVDLQRIHDLCEEHGIRLILFTNPMYYKTYEESKNYGYQLFLRWFAGRMDFYNFSGINDITTDRDNYFENSHYHEEVGDLIVDRIFYDVRDEELESQGFGYYVTNEGWDGFEKALANH